MKIFLTGGTGFIGKQLVRSLRARGWEVTALVRNPDSPQARALTKTGTQCVPGDILDRESMRPGMTGADMIVHNAGHYEYGLTADGKKRMRDINVRGTDTVLGLARELRVPRTIYVSTTQAFGDSGQELRDETFVRQAPCRTWYEQTKTDAHAIALRHQEQGLPLVIVCPNGVIGPNDHSVFGYFVRMYLNRMMPPLAWAPRTMFSFVHVDDLAEGIALAAEKGRTGETYLLTGESRSLREHLGFWAMKPGAFPARLWLPAWLMAALFWPLEPLQRLAGLPAFMSRETIRAGATNFNYSSDKAQRELGWNHRSAQDMWFSTIDGEIALMSKRIRRTLASLLNPSEIENP